MFLTQSLKRAAQVNRHGTATIDGEQKQTWEVFEQRVSKLAGALRALGLEAGGRVAVLSFNSARYLEYYFAIPWAGGIIVPLNTRLSPHELVYMLTDSGSQILIVDDAHATTAQELAAASTIKHIIQAGISPTQSGFRSEERRVGKGW